MNKGVVKNFITNQEKKQILDFISNFSFDQSIENEHIKSVANELKGSSFMFDLSKTDVTKYLTTFQSSDNVQEIEIPDFILSIQKRISSYLKIPIKNSFLQILDQKEGGRIKPHYDTATNGYINFKCNVSILSEDYNLNVDSEELNISEGDLYYFEASLYKHWTKEFNQRRVILSFGFALKYEDLGRSEDDPRVRLSKRIEKYFQKS